MTEEQRISVAALEARVDAIDMHGTRGMESVRAQLGQVQKDIGRIESAVDRTETAIQGMQLEMARTRPGVGAWVRDLAMIAPMYALVIDLIIRGLHG